MDSELPYVTVYTITYNQCHILQKAIQRLLNQDYPQQLWTLVVLDDGSTDHTAALLAECTRDSAIGIIVLSETHKHDYLSAKRYNQCIAHSPIETEVFIQIDDVLVRPDFIRQHVKWHIGERLYLVTGAKFEGHTETWRLSSCRRAKLAGRGGRAREFKQVTGAWGASMSFSRQLLERVYKPPHDIPYDERMSGWGFHEVELALRMQKAEATMVYDPQAGVFHHFHTTEEENIRGFDRRQIVELGAQRNRQYIMAKHALDMLPPYI